MYRSVRNLLLCLAVLAPVSLLAQNYGRMDFSLTTAQGQAVAGASVFVYTESACGQPAVALAVMYMSPTGGVITPQANGAQLLTDGTGHTAGYLPVACYTVTYSGNNVTTKTLADQVPQSSNAISPFPGVTSGGLGILDMKQLNSFNKGSSASNVLYAGTPISALLSAEADGGGRDSELEETPQTNLQSQLVSHTPGVVYDSQAQQYCYSPGDCIPIFLDAEGNGVSAAQNEGMDWHIRLQESGHVFQGTVNSLACTTGPAVCTFNLTQTQGWGNPPFGVQGPVGLQLGDSVQLIDITHGYNTGTISNIPLAGGPGCCNNPITGSGVNWDATFLDTFAKAVTTAAIDNGGGNNTFPKNNVTIPTGAWTGTFTVSSTPVCIFDELDTRYQCARITSALANTSITVDRLQWPITTGAHVDQGGLTGYCFGMDLDMVTAGNYGSYGDPTDSAVINPIRRCQPIEYNTSGNTLTLYTNSSGETQFTTRANPSVAGSGAYHIYPAAMTETVLNASTGNVDGNNVTTTPTVGTFITGDTVEQPHYYAGKGGGLNWGSNSWQSIPGWSQSFSFFYGGTSAWGGSQGYMTNANSPFAYFGLPAALSQATTPGYGTAVTPNGITLQGAYESGLSMNTPPFGQFRGMGALFVGCGTSYSFCSGWNAPVWLVTAMNQGQSGVNWPYAEDSESYDPVTYTWDVSAGGQGPNGSNATCHQQWTPTGWTQVGSACSTVGQGMPLLAPIAVSANIATAFNVGTTPAAGLPVNSFGFGWTDLANSASAGLSMWQGPGKGVDTKLAKYNIMNSGGDGWLFCTYDTSGGPVTITTPSQLNTCHMLPNTEYGTGTFDTVQTDTVGGVTSSATATGMVGPNAACTANPCTNISGSYQVTSTTFTTGNFLTLVWPATNSAYKCTVSQNGGTAFYGIGHAAATTTGLVISAAVSIIGATFQIDYSCQVQ